MDERQLRELELLAVAKLYGYEVRGTRSEGPAASAVQEVDLAPRASNLEPAMMDWSELRSAVAVKPKRSAVNNTSSDSNCGRRSADLSIRLA